MAGVNSSLLRQRLNEKRSKITDKEFFTSRLFSGSLEKIALVQTRRYHYDRRVRVYIFWNTNEQRLAWTDDHLISINAGHKAVTDVVGRENRYQIVCGLFAHELGHVLYTDFLMMQKYANDFSLSKWFPFKPRYRNARERDAIQEIWEYAKDEELNKKVLLSIVMDLHNIFEDGYIETRMLNDYPGRLGQCLNVWRNRQFKELTPTVTQLKENEDLHSVPIWSSLRDIMLSYVKFGDIKYGDEPMEDERIQTIFKLVPVLDDALFSVKSKDRFNAVNIVLIRCWEQVKEYCEWSKERYKEEQEKDCGAEVEKVVFKILRKNGGGSEIGKGNSKPVVGDSSMREASKTAASRAMIRKLAEQEDEESDEETEENAGNGEAIEEGASEDESMDETDMDSSVDADDTDLDMQGQNQPGERQEITSEEKGRIPLHYTERVSEHEGGGVQKDLDYDEEPYERAAEDIEKVLESIAKAQACEELETERLQELNDMARNISYGDVHKGVNFFVNRQTSVRESHIEQYNQISKPLATISKQLQRSILQRLQESRKSEKLSGLISGRRFDSHAIFRQDGKMFYKNRLPNETELAVGLVIDESGSMSGQNRSTYARATAIILEDFCRNLGVPVMIYGHSTSYRDGNSVELYSYVEFDTFDGDDKYRLMNVSSRGGNRDGAALRFVAERLVQRPEPKKLLMLISDGQPADYGYSGTAAEEDLRGIKREYQRQGVLFVAAAIGDDKQNIERIYGDSFLDITDLTQLPVKLTNVVKCHLRV